MSEKFYITTTLPYVNAPPHIGFALEMVQADAVARFERLEGKEVVFNTGTDEHGSKVYQKALEEGKEPQAYADEYAARFDRLREALDLSYTHFIRTTDPHHLLAAQEFWQRCDRNGDIYKAAYRMKYCVGCELEKTDSELVDGRCPIHPNLVLEEREEENYFFRFSKYGPALLELYGRYPDFVLPENRLTEIRNFVAAGLKDFSISRLKEKMPWGVPVPGDPDHVMYVWFDALVNYISTLGWPEKENDFRAFWGTPEEPRALQIAGKDNLRQQSAMWQAMLLSAGLPTSRRILIHGFVTSGGEKMSKSRGNVVDPFELAERYGTDAVRYWLLREMPAFEDGDFTVDKFEERYAGDLSNGLGNFASRTTALAKEPLVLSERRLDAEVESKIGETREKLRKSIAKFNFNEALADVQALVKFGDEYVNRKKPWETGDQDAIYGLVVLLDNLGALLQPFLPGTARKIIGSISHQDGRLAVTRMKALFPRLPNK